MTETELLLAHHASADGVYAARFRLGDLTYVRCACGGHLGADPESPASIAEAVRLHNGNSRHRAWRERMAIEEAEA